MSYTDGQQPVAFRPILPTLSVALHADSKVGKSTLSMTGPQPIVTFDAEGSTKFLPLRMVQWNPMMGPPPAYDGSWDATQVIVSDFDIMVRGVEWLETGQHQFQTVNLDSISEIQRKLKDRIRAGGAKFEWDHWGELLRRMDNVLRRFRDLNQHPINPVQLTVFVAETRMQNTGRYEPNLEGGIRAALPYWFDLIGYLKVENVKNSDGTPAYDQYGEPVQVRQLLTRPINPLYYAGERVQARVPAILQGHPTSTAPPTMWDATPHLTRDVLWRVFPHLVPQQATQ